MLDTIKFLTKNQNIIDRLYNHEKFQPCISQNRNYVAFSNMTNKMRLEFRKKIDKGRLIGFVHLEIIINPHYHYNNYLHNGNDFTISNCIRALRNIFSILNISESELQDLQVSNLEFGVNVIPKIDTKQIISGILFSNRTKFILPNEKLPYNKVTQTSSNNRYKEVKVYHKGIHCVEYLGIIEVHINTFRFEVKSKQARKIKSYKIRNAIDLFKIETYIILKNALINEWSKILLINMNVVNRLSIKSKTSMLQYNNFDFWDELIEKKHRNTFNINKEKYYKILLIKDNWHYQVGQQIIEKLNALIDIDI